MTIRKFRKRDVREINRWAKSHNLPPVDIGLLSRNGFIIPDVAAAWLYDTDSDVGYMDNCITNPLASPEARKEGISLLIRSIVSKAKVKKKKVLMAGTSFDTIKQKCEDHGFKEIGHKASLLGLNLEEK